jgi:hypothetical protein
LFHRAWVFEEALRRKAFDLVILGPTLIKNDRHHLRIWSRRRMPVRGFWLCTPMGERHPQVDVSMEPGRSIALLLQTIASMLPAQEANIRGRGGGVVGLAPALLSL